MTKGLTPRQVARAEIVGRIKDLALEQLAEGGATTLSLRAIARELNIVSSAIYRYYASRDDLITALIIDAYDDLAQRLEEAGGGRRGARGRWLDVCREMRSWAVAEPHRFALIYGSAIPGYAAPSDTIASAGRVVRALCTPAVDGAPTAERGRPTSGRPLGRALGRQLEASGQALDLSVDRETMLLLTGAFARLIGALTLELNGHLVGGFEPADGLYDELVQREADALGL